MLSKLLLLAASVAVVWYITRLSKQRGKPQVAEQKLVQCPRCKVYHESGGKCDCGDGGGAKNDDA